MRADSSQIRRTGEQKLDHEKRTSPAGHAGSVTARAVSASCPRAPCLAVFVCRSASDLSLPPWRLPVGWTIAPAAGERRARRRSEAATLYETLAAAAKVQHAAAAEMSIAVAERGSAAVTWSRAMPSFGTDQTILRTLTARTRSRWAHGWCFKASSTRGTAQRSR